MENLGGDHDERGVLLSTGLVGGEEREVESTRVLVGVSESGLCMRTNSGDGRFVGEFSHELLLSS